MKKKTNPLAEKAKDIFELIEEQEKIEAKQLAKILNEMKSIVSIEDKIKFLESNKKNYLINLPLKTFATSAVIIQNFPPVELFLDRLISKEIEKLKDLLPQQTETKTDKLKAPVLGLFCGLINKISIDKKEETESAAVYCERICGKFKLPYTDRVRQNYNVTETKKLMQELTEKVLPLIDNETKILIEKYFDNKQPPKQNLYA